MMDLGFKLRFVELNSRWKNLSEEERDEYCARAREAYVKFMEENPEHYLVRPSLLNVKFIDLGSLRLTEASNI